MEGYKAIFLILDSLFYSEMNGTFCLLACLNTLASTSAIVNWHWKKWQKCNEQNASVNKGRVKKNKHILYPHFVDKGGGVLESG